MYVLGHDGQVGIRFERNWLEMTLKKKKTQLKFYF